MSWFRQPKKYNTPGDMCRRQNAGRLHMSGIQFQANLHMWKKVKWLMRVSNQIILRRLWTTPMCLFCLAMKLMMVSLQKSMIRRIIALNGDKVSALLKFMITCLTWQEKASGMERKQSSHKYIPSSSYIEEHIMQ